MRPGRGAGPITILGLAAVGLAVAILLLVRAVSPPNPGQPGPSPADPAAQLLTAIQSHDQASFHAAFAARADPQRVATLWANLSQIEVLAVAPDPATGWWFDWRVPGEPGLVSHLAQPELDCQQQHCRLIDLHQYPAKPAPIWITGPITVHRAERVAVIGGGPAASWLAPAVTAASQIQATAPADLLRPSELTVVEVPADLTALEQVSAQTGFELAGAAGFEWQPGRAGRPDQSPTASRIVVNPASTSELSEQARAAVLVHEFSHAATRWLGQPVPANTWVAEGLAEWVSEQHSAASRQANTARLAQQCPATVPPPAADFSSVDPTALATAYAWSAAAVDQLLAQADGQATITRLWHDPQATVELAVACG